MDISTVDLIKIAITVVSVISLWYFRRQIVKVITDLLVGGDSSKYDGKQVSEIMEDIDNKLGEMLR